MQAHLLGKENANTVENTLTASHEVNNNHKHFDPRKRKKKDTPDMAGCTPVSRRALHINEVTIKRDFSVQL